MTRTALILAASPDRIDLGPRRLPKAVKAPDTPGVCYHAVPRANGTITFNELSAHEDTMEPAPDPWRGCGSGPWDGRKRPQHYGAYNGSYLFSTPAASTESQSYTGMRFPFLVHTDDGRLASPGAAQQQ